MSFLTYNRIYKELVERFTTLGVNITSHSVILQTLIDYISRENAVLQDTVGGYTQSTNLYDLSGENLTGFCNRIGIKRSAGLKSVGMIRLAPIKENTFTGFVATNGSVTLDSTNISFSFATKTYVPITSITIEAAAEYYDIFVEGISAGEVVVKAEEEALIDSEYVFNDVSATALALFTSGADLETDTSLKAKVIDTINSYGNAIGTLSLYFSELPTINSFDLKEDSHEYPNYIIAEIEPISYLYRDAIEANIQEHISENFPALTVELRMKRLFGISASVKIDDGTKLLAVKEYIEDYINGEEGITLQLDLLKAELIQYFDLVYVSWLSMCIGEVTPYQGAYDYLDIPVDVAESVINLKNYAANSSEEGKFVSYSVAISC